MNGGAITFTIISISTPATFAAEGLRLALTRPFSIIVNLGEEIPRSEPKVFVKRKEGFTCWTFPGFPGNSDIITAVRYRQRFSGRGRSLERRLPLLLPTPSLISPLCLSAITTSPEGRFGMDKLDGRFSIIVDAAEEDARHEIRTGQKEGLLAEFPPHRKE